MQGKPVKHLGRIEPQPPYVGGDDDEIETWTPTCECGYRGRAVAEVAVAQTRLIDHLNEALREQREQPIKVFAIYGRGGQVAIRDQHGRSFAGSDPRGLHADNAVDDGRVIEYELEAPRWPADAPRAIVKIDVPLDVEERMPEWMQEFMAERA